MEQRSCCLDLTWQSGGEHLQVGEREQDLQLPRNSLRRSTSRRAKVQEARACVLVEADPGLQTRGEEKSPAPRSLPEQAAASGGRRRLPL